MDTNSHRHAPKLAAIGLVAASLIACGAPVESEDIRDSVAPLAHENAWNLWPKVGNNYPVQVCFRACKLDDPDPDKVETQAQCDDGRQRVETALREYARHSRILLPQVINECANSGDRNPGWIRINQARPDINAGGTNTLVRYVNGVKEQKSGAGYPGTDWQVRTSTGSQNKGIIRHEFGHALGFAHEYRRSDEPAGTTCVDNGVDLTPQSGSVTNLTAEYDHDSIMNYSYCNAVKVLSPWDIAGLQSAYGLPFSRSFVNARWGTCLTGATLGACDGTTARQIGYNLSGLLGPAAGIHRTNQPSAVLNLRSDGVIQWNLNLVPGTAPTATWKLRNAMIVGLGGLCLTRGNADANVTLTKCAPGSAATQTWTFDARSASGRYVVASTGDASLCLNDVGGTLKAVWCTNLPNIRLDVGNGRIRNGGNNLCMVANGGKPVEGSTVKFVTCSTAADQQWLVRAHLENVATGTCLEASTATGALSAATCGTGSTETWDFHP